MSASNTPESGDRPVEGRGPVPASASDDATTEILAGVDPDRTPTEVRGGTADPTTRVLPETTGAPATALTPPAPVSGAGDPFATPPLGAGAHPLGAVPTPRPRVRWAGIVWGLVFAVSAALMLWVLTDPVRLDAVGAWWSSLTPIGFALTALLVAGGLLLIGGLAGLGRRLSHRRADSPDGAGHPY